MPYEYSFDGLIREAIGNQATDQLLDKLNQADRVSLSAVNGIGPLRADSIVAHRIEYGLFKTIREITAVEGIGVALAGQVIRYFAEPGDRLTIRQLMRRSPTEDEKYRAGLIRSDQEYQLLSYLNTHDADSIAREVDDIGIKLAKQIEQVRLENGNRFTRYMDVELISGLGGNRMSALLTRAAQYVAEKQKTEFDPFDPQANSTTALLDFLNAATTPAVVAAKFTGIGKTRATAILEQREKIQHFSHLNQLLDVPDIGSKSLVTMLNEFTTTTSEKSALEPMGEIAEPELRFLLQTPKYQRDFVLALINGAPSAEALASLINGLGQESASNLINQRDELGGQFSNIMEVEKAPNIDAGRLRLLTDMASRGLGDTANLTLNFIHEIIADEEQRPSWVEQLQLLAERSSDLPSLQYIAAALVAIDGDGETLERLREKVADPRLLGVPKNVWANIPAGEFLLGSPSESEFHQLDEGPQQEIAIAKPFELLATPVTTALFHVVLGKKKSLVGDLRQPMVNINWHDAVHFCERLAELQQKPIRLPSEKEWEYSCRATSQSPFWNGENVSDLDDVAWTAGKTEGPAPVAMKAPNPWGLYDVHGNVREWCQDIYQPYDVPVEQIYTSDDRRVLRGGSWIHDNIDARSASRAAENPLQMSDHIGFRIVRPLLDSPTGGSQPAQQASGASALGGNFAQMHSALPTLGEPVPANLAAGSARVDIFFASQAPPVDVLPLSQPLIVAPVNTMHGMIMPNDITCRGSAGIGYVPLPDTAILFGNDYTLIEETEEECECDPCPECPVCLDDGDLLPEEEQVIDDAAAAAEEEVKKQKEQIEDELEDELEENQADRDAADAENKRREEDPQRRARLDEEERLGDERKRLEEKQQELRDEQERIQRDQEEQTNRDRDLREREQELRRRGDPNCRGPECREVQRAREELAQDRLDSARDQQALDQERRQFDQERKNYQRDRDNLDRAMDRGFGQTEGEHRRRQLRKQMDQYQREADSIQSTLDRIQDREDRQGGLSNEDKRLRNHLENQLDEINNRLDGGIGEAGNMQTRLEEISNRFKHLSESGQAGSDEWNDLIQEQGELTNRLKETYDNYADSLAGRSQLDMVRESQGDAAAAELRDYWSDPTESSDAARESLRRARRDMMIREFSDSELTQFRGDLQRAEQGLQNALDRVGRPGFDGNRGINFGADERRRLQQRLDQAEENFERIQNRRDYLNRERAGNERALRNLRNSLRQARDELRRLNGSEWAEPSGPNAGEIKQLQDVIDLYKRRLTEFGSEQQAVEQELRQLGREYGDARKRSLLARPLGRAARGQGVVDEFNNDISRYWDAQGNFDRDAFKREVGRQYINAIRHANLVQREANLRNALENGNAPPGAHQRLHRIQNGRQQAEQQLGNGWSLSDDGRTMYPDGSTLESRGLRSGLREQIKRQAEENNYPPSADNPLPNDDIVAQHVGNGAASEITERSPANTDGMPDTSRVLVNARNEIADEANTAVAEKINNNQQQDPNETQQRDALNSLLADLVAEDDIEPVRLALNTAADFIGLNTVVEYVKTRQAMGGTALASPTRIINEIFQPMEVVAGVAGNTMSVVAVQIAKTKALSRLNLALNKEQQKEQQKAEKDSSDTTTTKKDTKSKQQQIEEAEQKELDELKALAQRYGELEEIAEQRGDVVGAARARAVKQGLQTAVRARETDEPIDAESAMDAVSEELEFEIELAQANGNLELAQELARTVLQAQGLVHGALKKRIENADEDSEQQEQAIAEAKRGSLKFADALENYGEITEDLANAEQDPDAADALRHEARNAGIQAAANLLDGEAWREALNLLDSIDALNAQQQQWKAQLAIQGFVALQAQEPPAPVHDTDAPVDRNQWWDLQDEFLQRFENWSDDPGEIARAQRIRAQHRFEQQDRAAALDILRKAQANLPDDREIALQRLQVLLSDQLSDAELDEVFELMEKFNINAADDDEAAASRAQEASFVDRLALQSLMEQFGTDTIEQLRDKVVNSNLNDDRKNTWLLFIDTPQLFNDVQNGGLSSTTIHQRADTLRDKIDDSSLTPEEREIFRQDLDNITSQLTTYEQERDSILSQPAQVTPDRFLELLGKAIFYEEFDVVESILQHLADSPIVPAAEKLANLLSIARLFNEQISADPDNAARWRQLLQRARQISAQLKTTEVERLRGELADISREQLSPPPLDPFDPFWHAYENAAGDPLQTMWNLSKIPFQGDVIQAPFSQQRRQEMRRQDALAQRRDYAWQQLRIITQYNSEMQLLDLSDEQIRVRISDERQQRQQELSSLRNLAEQNAENTTQDTEATRIRATSIQAEIVTKQLELYAWDDHAIKRDMVQYRRRWGDTLGDSAVEKAIEEQLLLRYGETAGISGLQTDLDSHQQWTDSDDIGGQIQYRLDFDQNLLAQFRINDLIGHAAVLDPLNADANQQAYQNKIAAQVILRERDLAQRNANYYRSEYEAFTLMDVYDEWANEWQRRADFQQYRFDNNPANTGSLALDEDYSPEAYVEGLIRGLDQMWFARQRQFTEYIPQSRWDHGIVQVWNLHYAAYAEDWLGWQPDAETSSAHRYVYQRFWHFTGKIQSLQVALRKAKNREQLTPEQRQQLLDMGIIEEIEEAQTGLVTYRLVIPEDLDLSTLDDKLHLTEKSVWDHVFNTRSLTEMLAIVVTGGLASGAASASLARLAASMQLGRILTFELTVTGEAVAFTAASRAVGFGFNKALGYNPNHQNQSLLGELAFNIGIFSMFRGFNAIAGQLSKATGVASRVAKFTESNLWINRDFLVNAATVLRYVSEGAVMTGIQSLQSGQPITLDLFVQNLLDFPLAHRFNRWALGQNKKPRPAAVGADGPRIPAVEAQPIRGEPEIDPKRGRRVDGKYKNIFDRFGGEDQTSRLNNAVADELGLWRPELEAAGIELVERTDGGQAGTFLSRNATGKFSIHYDGSTSRVDLLNEVFKAREIERRGITPDMPFTREMEASIEVASYRQLERDLLRGSGVTTNPRYGNSVQMSFSWRERLQKIRDGKIENTILHDAGEGLVIFAKPASKVAKLREALKLHLRLDATQLKDSELAKLTAEARQMLDEDFIPQYKAREEMIQLLRDELARLELDPTANAERIDTVYKRLQDAEAMLAETKNAIMKILKGLHKRRGPDIRLELDYDKAQFNVRDRAKYDALTKERNNLLEQIEQALVRANDPNLSSAQRRKALRDIRRLYRERHMVSQRLGEDAGIDFILSLPEFEGARIFLQGTGARQFDTILEMPNGDLVIIEEKGGSSTIGSKYIFEILSPNNPDAVNITGRSRAEQGAPAYQVTTAAELIMDGQRYINHPDKVLAQREAYRSKRRYPPRPGVVRPVDLNLTESAIRWDGRQRLDAGERILGQLASGRLKFYKTQTGWVEKTVVLPNGTTKTVYEAGATSLVPAKMDFKGIGPNERVITRHKVSDPTTANRNVRSATFSFDVDNHIRIDSNGKATGKEAVLLETVANQVNRARRQGADLAVFPQGLIQIRRSDYGANVSSLHADPTIVELRRLAQQHGVHIAVGVDFMLADGTVQSFGLVVKPDGNTQWLAPEVGGNSRTHLTEINGVQIGFTLGSGEKFTPNNGAEINVVIGNAKPDSFKQLLDSTPNSLGANWRIENPMEVIETPSGKNTFQEPAIGVPYFELNDHIWNPS